MKTFDQLTDAEVVALTLEDLQKYIDYECLEAGIPLLTDPGPSPVIGIVEDLTCYDVAGLTFTDRNEAFKVYDVLTRLGSRIELAYGGGPGYKMRAKAAGPVPELTEKRVFSESLFETRSATLAEQERHVAEWQHRRDTYDRTAMRRRLIADEINTRRGDAYKTTRRIEAIREQHARYVLLANGNKRTASRFLLAFDQDAQTLCPELFDFTADDPADVPLSGTRFYSSDDAKPTVQEEF